MKNAQRTKKQLEAVTARSMISIQTSSKIQALTGATQCGERCISIALFQLVDGCSEVIACVREV